LLDFNGLEGLFYSTPTRISKESGVGRAKSALLNSIKELVHRLKLSKIQSKKISLQKIYELLYFRTLKDTRESFYTITLNHEQELIQLDLLARGGLNEVGVFTRDIVKIALDDGAKFLIIAHNHPNQSAVASQEDRNLFKKLNSLLLELEIELLDQWIFGNEGIFSCSKNKLVYPTKV
jgi:DNA repair protein RadC